MPDNTITASARISETVWVQLKIMARKEGRTMNDLVGQALTEWLGFVRQAIKDKWSFIVVGDSRGNDKGINSEVINRLVMAITNEHAEFVLFPGDLISGYAIPEANTDMLMENQLLVEPSRTARGFS